MLTARTWALALLPFLACRLLAAAEVAAAAGSGPDADAAIMQRLRASVRESDPDWLVGKPGWMPGAREVPDAHPCLWEEIQCDAQQRITKVMLVSFDAPGPNANQSNPSAGPLLPDLAQLGRLEELIFIRYAAPPWHSIPAEWLAPGAFLRLKWLSLAGRSLAAPLPDIRPGSLPSLEHLDFEFRELRTTLPPSWGASPAVLPGLLQLSISAQIEGQLPAGWSAGFWQLQEMQLANLPQLPGQTVVQNAGYAGLAGNEAFVLQLNKALAQAAAMGVPRSGATGRLPDEWAAAGGFPELLGLSLVNLDLAGPLPSSWQHGFPALTSWDLPYCGLTGTLPAWLAANRNVPAETIRLSNNLFTGTLPAEWATSQTFAISLSNNSLSGPLFPPAWLEPGTLPRLRQYDVSGNRQLAGTLSEGLAWPRLQSLLLAGTQLTGTIPQAWCQAPFAATLEYLWINGTAANPALPACTEVPSPTERWQLSSPESNSMAEPAPPDAAAGAPTGISAAPTSVSAAAVGAASLALLLPLSFAAMSLLLWRQRKSRQRHVGNVADAEVLLQQRHGGSSTADDHTSTAAQNEMGSSQHSPDNSRQLSRRQQRLGALLSAASGGKPSSAIKLARLPETLQLSAAPWGAHCVVPSAAGAEHGVPPLPLAEVAMTRSSLSSRPAGNDASWGLPTNSLQVDPEHVELMKDHSGHLVVLGEGSHAVVYLARLQGLLVAAKVMEVLPGMEKNKVWREVELMRKCTHERVVPILGVALKANLLILVIQIMAGGTLQKALTEPESREKLRWQTRGRQVALDVAEALHFLHTQAGVQHNDLKPSNVLLTADLRACISDLGVAQVACSKGRTIEFFTLSHAAPEQLLGQRCTPAADMYSFGVILIELTTQSPLVKRGQWCLPLVPSECSLGVLALIEQCISPDPARRPSATEALEQLRADAGNASAS